MSDVQSYCPNCGKPAAGAYCAYCGTAIPANDSAKWHATPEDAESAHVEATVVSESTPDASQPTQTVYTAPASATPTEVPVSDSTYRYSVKNGWSAADSATAPQEPTRETKPKTEKKSKKSKKENKEKKKGKGLKIFGIALAIILVIAGAGVGGALIAKSLSNDSDSGTVTVTDPTGSTITINTDDDDYTVSEAVSAKALPSVVSIKVTITSETSTINMFGYGDSGTTTSTGSASGVIISDDGYILTNNHVVDDATSISVITNDNTEYEATVVGTDPSSDLAVIKVEATGLTPIEIGDSDDLSVGEWVMTIGSPFGLDTCVSSGIVSALSCSTSMTDSSSGTSIYANLIQTDASINPGNSGGALVNSRGELVGICSLFESYSGSSSNVGFAIPSNYAYNIAKQLMAGNKAEHAYMGVSMMTLSSEVVSYYNLDTELTSGVYVSSVVDDEAADEAGIEEGDVIVSFNGEKVLTADSVIIAVRSCDIGETVDVVINRDGKEQTVKVTLGSDDGEDIYGSSTKYVDTNENSGNGNGGNGYGYQDYGYPY